MCRLSSAPVTGAVTRNLVASTTWSRIGASALPDQPLVVAGGVALGGVVEGAAEVERGPDQVDRFRFIDPGSVAVAEPHGPQPDG